MGYNDFGNPKNTATPYTIDSIIGRSDSRDIVQFSTMTVVSGAASLLPTNPLGRRNFIRVKNNGGASVYITTADATSSGHEVPTGQEWEENTDAVLYVATAAGTVDIQVYERAARFNYR